MSKYDLRLILNVPIEFTEEFADSFFEAGCDDGAPAICNNMCSIDFHREAASLENAIRTAIANVNSVGYDVAHVEIDAASMPQTV